MSDLGSNALYGAHGALAVKGRPPSGTLTVDVETREANPARLRGLVESYFDFVWRSLRRLGVDDADADDGAQQVFLVASRKLSHIEPGAERSFLFGTAMRVASDARRSKRRRREVPEDDAPNERSDPGPTPEETLDRRRARALLDDVLEALPMDLRAVFVLYELEEMTVPEIASMLGLAGGTAASRLRRAREEFERIVAREKARRGHGGRL